MDLIATRTITAFLLVLDEGRAMAKAGAVGSVLRDMMHPARELLDILTRVRH